MQPPNSTSISLRPELTELPRLINCIEQFANAQDLAPQHALALSVAAEELFANTVHHGVPPAHSVDLSLSIADGCAIGIYSDDAGPFDPTQHAAADTALSADQRAIGGLGIHFIRRAMRQFEYRRVDLRNVIIFTRALATSGEPQQPSTIPPPE